MSLTTIYERFAASPNPLSLANNASLHYVPTLTTFVEQGPIVKHLQSQSRTVVRIKSQKTISAIEGPNAVAIEFETTLEFISGGGAYLPGLENLIADKVATLPTTHIVSFDHDQKIRQIRISWDQASLLKQTDVIGSRGRAWPVFDGKDQVRIIASSSRAGPVETPISPRGRNMDENETPPRNPSPSKKYARDPHTSLDSFWHDKPNDNKALSPANKVVPVATRTSARPPPREMSELFAAGNEDYKHPTSNAAPPANNRMSTRPPPREMSELFAAGHEDLEPSAANGGSPNKSYATPALAPKGAGSQKFQPNRIFSDDENTKTPTGYKTNPARYNHFDLGDADDNDSFQHRAGGTGQAAHLPMRARTDKGGSQWDFSDFVTPAKPGQKVRDQDLPQFGWDDEHAGRGNPGKAAHKPRKDAESQFEMEDDGTPVERHAAPKPRPDAESHFVFNDQPTPAPRRIIARTAAAQGIYRNALEEALEDDEKAPLSTITNNTNRKNDFNSHWQMDDESPAGAKINNENKGIGGDHNKAVQMMDSHWNNDSQSPEQNKRPTSKSFKGAMETHWSMGGDEQTPPPTKKAAPQAQKGFWDF